MTKEQSWWAACVVLLLGGLCGPAIGADGRKHALEDGLALIKQGRYSDAETLARQRLPEVEAAHGADSLEASDVLDVLVEAHQRGGKTSDPELRAMGERAVGIKERLLGTEDPELANSLNSLASLVLAQSDSRSAEVLFNRALAIREKALGPEHPEVAASLNQLAILHAEGGNHEASRGLFERALTIREKALGPDHSLVAYTLNNLATLTKLQGDYVAARIHYERALSIMQKTLGPDHVSNAKALDNLGILLRQQGDYAAARSYHDGALALREKALGPDHPDVGVSLHNSAALLSAQGDTAAARALYLRSLAIHEKAFGPEHPKVAANLLALANMSRDLGDAAAARPLFERALAIREKALGPDHPEVASSLHDLANLVADQGEYAAARQLYGRSLAIREKVFGPEHPTVARTFSNLASVLRDEGDHVGARPLFERALLIREKALGPEHPDVARSLADLSWLALRLGDGERALDMAIRAEDINRAHLRLTARALAEREVLAYAARRAGALDLSLGVASVRREPAATRRAWDALVRSRALVLDEMARRHRTARLSPATDLLPFTQELSTARQLLANVLVRGPGDRTQAYREAVGKAQDRRERAERALAERSAEFRQEQDRQRLGYAEVAGAMPPGAALVAYARYDSDPGRKTTDPAKHAYVAFVLAGRSAAPVVVPLGDASGIEALVTRWRVEASGAAAAGKVAQRAEDRYRAAAEVLRARVWDPVAAHLRGARQVYLVPDGALHLVSFAALPTGAGRYLVETGPLLHLLSAERDLVNPAAPPASGGTLLALGGPAYDDRTLFAALDPNAGATTAPATPTPDRVVGTPVNPGLPAARVYRGSRSACGALESLRFESLEETLHEVDTVADLWSVAGGRPAAAVRKLTGREASEQAFKEEAGGSRILHLATHGFFLGDQCTAEENDAVAVQTRPGENPLLLSGLALAGANHRASAGPDEDDGILTAEEVAALDLSNVEWAVLSACDTGTGDVRGGEGVFGLRRAFQVAGARSLVLSLWSVDDASTRRWMQALYEARFLKRRTTAEAIRDASLKIVGERRRKGEGTHPFFWAGFVATGDWR